KMGYNPASVKGPVLNFFTIAILGEMTAMTQAPLQGRAALVTGAGVGIGRAAAEALAGAGAFVGLHYHSSADGARDALAAVEARGGRGVLLRAALADADQARRLVDDFVKHAGRLDVLVNNAGSPLRRARVEDCPLELWQQVLAVNLTSAFLVT